MTAATFSEDLGQHWPQFCQLLLAVGLSAAIGIERQLRHKSAGLRTNTLVGLGSALFMLVSKYGFTDVLSRSQVVVDPSRIAAQIVSGIGFIGGGIIFKQQSDVRGLTTAAAVWLTSAVGSACGAGLPILAALSTALYFCTVTVLPLAWIAVERLRARNKAADVVLSIRYASQNTGLEPILDELLKSGATLLVLNRVEEVMLSALHSPALGRQPTRQGDSNSTLPPPMLSQGYRRIFDVKLSLKCSASVNDVLCSLSQLESVISVSMDDDDNDEV